MEANRNRMSRRSLLTGLAAVAGTAALAACGATPTPQVVEKVVEKEITKIVEGTPVVVKETVVITETQVVEKVVKETAASEGFVTLNAPYSPGYSVELEAFNRYEELVPNVKIIAPAVPGGTPGYLQRILADVASGVYPDLWYVQPDYLLVLLKKDILMDLTPAIEVDNFDLENFMGPGKDSFASEGKIYGLPYACNPWLWIYNKQLLADKGATDLKELDAAGKWNWDSLAETAVKCTGGEGADATVGLWTSYFDWVIYNQQWLWCNDAQNFSDDLKTCTMDSPEATEALQYVADLHTKYKVLPTSAMQQFFSGGFTTGHVGMTMGGRWVFHAMAEMDEPPDAGMVLWSPGPGGTRATEIGWDGYCIPKQAPHPEEARKLLEWLTGDECQLIYLASSVPFTKSILESQAFKDSMRPGEDYDVIMQTFSILRNVQAPVGLTEIQNEWKPLSDAIVLGQKTVDEALTEFVPKANSILALG